MVRKSFNIKNRGAESEEPCGQMFNDSFVGRVANSDYRLCFDNVINTCVTAPMWGVSKLLDKAPIREHRAAVRA
jgi:hypothetical protein